MKNRKNWNDIPFLRTTDSLQTVKKESIYIYLKSAF